MAVDHFQLSLPLKAHDDGIVAFAVLGEGSEKLGKTLQAGQLVAHKPDPFLMGFRFVQQAQHEHVDPYALQWTKRLALGWKRGDEDPTLACVRPLCRGPFSVARALVRQEPKAL